MIYFASYVPSGPVKIGHTAATIKQKMSILQTYSPTPVILFRVMPGDTRHERGTHYLFRDNHIHGEWFHFHPAMLTVEKVEPMDATWTLPRHLRRETFTARRCPANWPVSAELETILEKALSREAA